MQKEKPSIYLSAKDQRAGEFFLSELVKIPLRLIEDGTIVGHKEYSYYFNNFGKRFQRGK